MVPEPLIDALHHEVSAAAFAAAVGAAAVGAAAGSAGTCCWPCWRGRPAATHRPAVCPSAGSDGEQQAAGGRRGPQQRRQPLARDRGRHMCHKVGLLSKGAGWEAGGRGAG